MSTRFSRRRALQLMGAGAAGLSLPAAIAQAARQAGEPASKAPADAPNIIFIMTDDQARDAVGIYGNDILATPNMDRIGAEGIRFNQAFVTNSICAPSRASFLTGLYSHTHGVTSNGEEPGFYGQGGLRHDQITWPMLLRKAGYHTGMVGKWHIKSDPTGFDHWAILRGQGSYFDPECIVNGASVRFRGHTDDVIGDQAIAYLRQRPDDQPFCLCYHFKAPHGPWEPDARFYDAFQDVEIPIPVAFEQGPPEGAPEALSKTRMSVAGMGDFHRNLERRGVQVPKDLPDDERAHANLQALVKNYYRVLLGVDENVGRVLDFLDQNDLAENTIVVYTSDNGFFLGEYGFYDKRLMYEPSIRVPMLVRWPRRIAAGQVDDGNMVLNVDVAPTLLELAGAAAPDWMHGRSWKPLLDGEPAEWREDFLYEFFEYPAVHCVRKHRGVRGKRWKLIHFWEMPDEWALYDLENDPDELVNLVNRPEHAERVERLRARLLELRAETGDVDPPGYVPPEMETGHCPA